MALALFVVPLTFWYIISLISKADDWKKKKHHTSQILM